MTTPLLAKPDRKPPPRLWVSVALFFAAMALMAYLRLYVYNDTFITLSYGLPLLVCLWHRDKRLLWSLVAGFFAMSSYKAFRILGIDSPLDVTQFGMQLLNTLVIAGAIHIILVLLERLAEKNQRLEALNEELAAQADEIAGQNERLQAQAEELGRQNEELQQQGEELTQQNEELEHQSEELQAQGEELQHLNLELQSRERMLSLILGSMNNPSGEQQMLQNVCETLLQLVGGQAMAAAVIEKAGSDLLLRTWVGPHPPAERRKQIRGSFSEIILSQGRTAFVEDLLHRPDLRPATGNCAVIFHSVLGTPLRLKDQVVGVVEIYSREPRAWTAEDFRLIEWVAAKCSLVLGILRLQESLRESENRFRTMADSLPQLAWTADASGRVEWMNCRWREFAGMLADHPQDWTRPVPEDSRFHVLKQWHQSLDSGSAFDMECPMRGKDGLTRWFLTHIVPIKDAKGEVLRWVGTHTDIHETREAALAVQVARDELAQANSHLESLVQQRTAKLQEMVNELEHFSYTITHDMRAPLRAMQGFAGMLGEILEPQLNAEARTCLDRIAGSARRMDQLITDALSYSKAVQQELEVAPVDIRALLSGIIYSYPDLQPPRANIRIEGTMPTVLGNEAGLTQCFSNLLGNAVKFVAPGRVPEVCIRAETCRDRVRVWFEDNGIGIPAAAQPRIFQMFQRVSKTYEGTGIGLALVRKMTERMGGQVGVESEPGKGSRFWLEFRCASSVQELGRRDVSF